MPTYTYVNADLDILASNATAYTCPAATTAVVIGCQVANVDGTNSANVSVFWTDDSAADKVTYLCKTVAVPANESFAPVAGKLVLAAGDTLQAVASAAGDLELTASVLEIS